MIDEVIPVLSRADDGGNLRECVTVAIEGLGESVEQLGKAEQKAVFAYCLEHIRLKDVEAAEFVWDMLRTAQRLVDSPARRTLFTSTLEDIEAKMPRRGSGGYYGEYNLETIALLRLSLIDRFDGRDASYTFLKANADMDALRMVLIERCIDQGALDQAMQYIQDGIAATTQRHWSAWTAQYQALRVNLLQRHGDTSNLIDAARKLWFASGNEQTFALLEQMVPKAEWSAFVDRLIKDTRQPLYLAWLYAHENRWSELMSLIQSHSEGSRLLDPYREALESRFPDTMAALYEQTIDRLLQRATDRGAYKQVPPMCVRSGTSGRQRGQMRLWSVFAYNTPAAARCLINYPACDAVILRAWRTTCEEAMLWDAHVEQMYPALR